MAEPSEFLPGRCARCIPRQVLVGTIILDRVRAAEVRHNATNYNKFLEYCDFFRKRPADWPPPRDPEDGHVFASAEEYAAARIWHDTRICNRHDRRTDNREARMQDIVQHCPGILQLELQSPDGQAEAVRFCPRIDQIESITSEFEPNN